MLKYILKKDKYEPLIGGGNKYYNKYYNKYLKYKKKYLNLKKILGGNIFNKIYDKLIKIFRDINKINDPLFGFRDIIHIKGGASIKYHLQKYMIAPDALTRLTNDIDILVILDDYKLENLELFNENKKNFVIFILETIKKNIPEYNWNYKESNQLYNICIENDDIECFIDITFYNPFDEDIDIDDDTSLFQYALRTNNYINMKSYIDTIRLNASKIDSEFDITDDNIEPILIFLRFSPSKPLKVFNSSSGTLPFISSFNASCLCIITSISSIAPLSVFNCSSLNVPNKVCTVVIDFPYSVSEILLSWKSLI